MGRSDERLTERCWEDIHKAVRNDPMGNMLTEKVRTLQKRVKDIDRSATPKTRRSELDKLKGELHEVIKIALPLRP